MPERIRVTLRWIQILDTLEPFYEKRGEFRFLARVSADGQVRETRLPRDGHYEISADPQWNQLKLDRVLYEGPAESMLQIELAGEELDVLTSNDRLATYRREFRGAPSTWIGAYGAASAAEQVDPALPENMRKWRLSYLIEKI
jgi:hypothetical protein